MKNVMTALTVRPAAQGRWLFLLLALFLGQAQSAEYHVAVHGTGDGSLSAPWGLQQALDATGVVKPGDTLWVHGGIYRGGFTSRLEGTAEAPIIIRAAPGKAVTVDCNPRDEKDAGLFSILGSGTTLWGMEFTCSDSRRKTEQPGSWPKDVRRGGISSRGSHNRLINLVVHDTGGVGFWGNEEEGEGGEIYGCLIYHNGWLGPDRGHGHGIYAQNARGMKHLEDNVIFSQFGIGLHCYGSQKASLSGFHVEGNVCFHNGCLVAPDSRSQGIFLGGGAPLERTTVKDNFTHGGDGLKLGYAENVVGQDVTATGNYMAGSVQTVGMAALKFTGNTIIAPGTLASLNAGPVRESPGTWDENRYHRTKVEWAAFNIKLVGAEKVTGATFAEWQARTGCDQNSTYVEHRPEVNVVKVRPNRHEPGRAHVIVYNWERKDTVDVDLSDVLKAGQAFDIVSAQDFYGAAVAEGVHEPGKPVRLPMKEARRPAQPLGMEDYPLPQTGIEFGVYVVLPQEK